MAFEKTFCDISAKGPMNEEETERFSARMAELSLAFNHLTKAYKEVMQGLSMAYPQLNLNDCNLERTPERMARALLEMCSGLGVKDEEIFTQSFPAENYSGMIVLKDIEYVSLCAHHFIPFQGKAHIAYIPNSDHSNSQVVGLSKLARIVDAYAKRPQLQERLCVEIMQSIKNQLHPEGIMVMVEGKHGCLGCRGAHKPLSTMLTTSTDGTFNTNPHLRNEFFAQLK